MADYGKRTRLVLVLASGASVAAAARKLGCARQTVFRRLQAPDFRRAVAQARGQIAGPTCWKSSRHCLLDCGKGRQGEVKVLNGGLTPLIRIRR